MAAVADRLDLSLSYVKTLLRVEHDALDAQIQDLIDDAKAQADDFLGNPFTDEDGNELPIPGAVRRWVLRCIQGEYANGASGLAAQNVSGHGGATWSAEERKADTWRLLGPHRKIPGF